VALVAVALDRDVLRAVESLVGPTAVISFAILVRGALVAPNGPAACNSSLINLNYSKTLA